MIRTGIDLGGTKIEGIALSETGEELFREEVRRAAKRITVYPEAWSVERGDIRKCLLHKFPYKLLYSIEEDHIFIIAVAHQHRKPDYWI